MVTSDHTTGLLLIVGSVVFLVGAAVGVPRVFTEPDPQARLRLLTDHLGMWRIAQPLYGLGPVLAAAGVGWLTAAAPTRATRATFAAACLALAVGALAWAWSVYLRGTRVAEFAFGTLPGWPFATYVLLTIGGLALLAPACSPPGSRPGWVGSPWAPTCSSWPATCGSRTSRRSCSTCCSSWPAWSWPDGLASAACRTQLPSPRPLTSG